MPGTDAKHELVRTTILTHGGSDQRLAWFIEVESNDSRTLHHDTIRQAAADGTEFKT